MERQETLTVSGMHCEACVKRIEEAVRSLAGLRDVEVDLTSGEVHVVFDAEALECAEIADAISALGYAVSLADDDEEQLH